MEMPTPDDHLFDPSKVRPTHQVATDNTENSDSCDDDLNGNIIALEEEIQGYRDDIVNARADIKNAEEEIAVLELELAKLKSS